MLLCFSPAPCHCCHHGSLSCHSGLLSSLPPSCDWLHTPHCPLPCLLNVQLLYTVHITVHLYTLREEHWPSLHRIQAHVLIIPHHHYHHYHHFGPHRAPHPGTLSLCMNKSRVSWRDPLHYYRLYLGDSQHTKQGQGGSHNNNNWVLTLIWNKSPVINDSEIQGEIMNYGEIFYNSISIFAITYTSSYIRSLSWYFQSTRAAWRGSIIH